MLKIGYNISDQHIGSDTHLECPERINYSIRNMLTNLPSDLFLTNNTYSKSTLLEMIKRVHSNKYLSHLLTYVPKDYTCRKCTNRKLSNGMRFAEYIEGVKICSTCKGDNKEITETSVYCYLDADTYYTPRTFDIVLDGVGVLKQLLDEIKSGVRYGLALIRPPGHHCENAGSGFCVMNNALIASTYAQTLGYAKVFILDIDFHHGDGTQKLLMSNKSLENIYFCSMHGYGYGVYPGTGSRSENTKHILNIPLQIDIYDDSTRKKIDDNYYLQIVETEVNNFILKSNPSIIILSCGFDGHQNDTLQGLNLSDNAYRRIVRHLKTFNIPILIVLEGGYNKFAIYNSLSGMVEEMQL